MKTVERYLAQSAGVAALMFVAACSAEAPETDAAAPKPQYDPGLLSYTAAGEKTVHTADIPLGPAGWDEDRLEYKVYMQPGQGALYSWEALGPEGVPADVAVEYDFHGHDVVEEGEEETVIQYSAAEALVDAGSFTAPMEGIHGWYFRNHSDDPVTIRLVVEGYFDVIPPGEPGNEFRIRPSQ